MKTPLVSVLLVTYNQDTFIRKVIEGVLLQQVNFNMELVIGEDCSSDATWSICNEYASNYPEIIRLLPSVQNYGLNLNFIRTLKECRGKYIAYLEGDDWWITIDKIQKQVDILEKEDDVSLVHTNCKIFNVEKSEYNDRLIRFEGECISEKSFGIGGVIAEFEGRFRPMKTSTCCYRRSMIEEIITNDEFLFTNTEFPTQDFQLFQEMRLKGRFVFIDEVTTVIGLHESISASKNIEKSFAFRLGFFKIGIYLIDKYQLPQKARDIWLRKELYYFLNYGVQYGNKSSILWVKKEATNRNYKLPYTQLIKFLFIKIIKHQKANER